MNVHTSLYRSGVARSCKAYSNCDGKVDDGFTADHIVTVEGSIRQQLMHYMNNTHSRGCGLER